MQIVFFTESLAENSLGRTYSLWLLARSLGWRPRVLSVAGDSIWSPLKGSEFAESCELVSPAEAAQIVAANTDLIVACKPLAQSLGVAIEVARDRQVPILVDVDDPDLEALLRIGRPAQRVARAVRRPGRTARDLRLRREVMRRPCLVSNPWLQARYGGTLIPHARSDIGAGTQSESTTPHLVFVGTNRPHKGVRVLREAVASLKDSGFTLTVTDTPPDDAKPWESWVGTTSLDDGVELVRRADIIAIPSLRTRQAEGQLPAKLIDAMLLGRAVVVTDVEPMPWALGRTGIVVPAGSSQALASALYSLRDAGVRRQLGDSARVRALEEFTVGALASRFEAACYRASGRMSQDGIT